MSSMDSLAGELYSLMKESDERKPKPYDTTAEVVRVEEGTVWVHIDGGIEETPVKKTMDAKKGDKVRVHVANGSAWLTGNESAPPTDDTTAVYATKVASSADSKAAGARAVADEASLYASIARDESIRAQDEARNAKRSAQEAQDRADQIENIAENASQSASNAYSSAVNASQKADSANNSANAASISANSAYYHLSEIEKVVDALNWISNHGTYQITDDTEIVDGKWYFTVTTDGAYVVGSPVSNPHTEGFYELKDVDSAVSNYISTHLYLDNDGLYVQMDKDRSSKLKITGNGIYLINSNGETIAQYSNSVVLGDPNSSHIELSPTFGLGFYQTAKIEEGGVPINRVAYIQYDRLFIQSATLTNNLQIGNFRWVVLDHRISLKYNPI